MRYFKKACAVTLSAAMTMGLLISNGTVSYAAEKVEKEETVYVNQKADGTIDEVTVSNWLKNVTGTGDISDVSNLKDIKNVKGDETFTQGSNGELTWKANNADIYYQGTTDEKPPVDVTVSYKLDGKQMKPEEMAGKSGKVTITIQYENNSSFEKKIDGKDTKLQTPFLMASAVILPVDTFSEVTVSQGKVVSEGSNQILVAYGMPGLSSSLDLSDDLKEEMDDKLSDTVTITAQVTDFSMGSIYTVATSNEFTDIDLDDNSDLDDLEDAVNDLADATDELISGSSDLSDGITTLQDNFKTYASGVSDVSNGASSLSDGAGKLADGITKYTNGVTTLTNGAGKYVDGANSLASGVKSYVAGEKKLAQGISDLYDQSKGFPAMYESSFESGLNTYIDTVNSLPNLVGSTISDSLTTITQSYEGAVKNAATASVDMSDVEKALDATELTAEQKKEILDAASKAAATAVQTQKATDLATVQYVGSQVKSSGTDLSAFDQLKQAGDQLKSGSALIKQNLSKVVAGIGSVQEGAAALSDANDALVSGADTLSKSGSSLTAGISSLTESTKTLTSSAGALSKGASKLSQGASKLDQATGQVSEGVDKLQSGSVELLDGMNQFKDEGTGKLQSEYNDNVKSVMDRFKALTEDSAEYKTFSGISDDMDGTVKFIFQTAEIKNDK